MTKEELDLIGSMNMCDEISNEAYKKIMIHCEEQSPCEDAVSRKEAIASIRTLYPGMPRADFTGHRRLEWSRKHSQYLECEKAIMDLPSITPIRPKGEWIVKEDNTSFVRQIPRRWVECSHCGWSFSYDRIKDDFCSKCGADMKKGRRITEC